MHRRRMALNLLLFGVAMFTSNTVDFGNSPESLFAGLSGELLSYGATVPSVTSTLPLNNATDVELNRWIKATFSEAMNASTITTSTFKLQKITSGTVTVNITEVGPPITTYTRVLSYSTSPFAGIYSGYYTGNASGSFIAGVADNKSLRGVVDDNDTVSTTISGSSSPWGFDAWSTGGGHFWGSATAASVSGNWSHPPYGGTLSGTKTYGWDGYKTVYTASDSVSVTDADVSGSSITYAFVDIQKMDSGSGFGSIDASGNFSISSIYSLLHGIKIASATGTVNPNLVNITGTVSYDPATRTAILIPSANLEPSTGYRATISKTATSSYGVQMAADYIWDFTSGSSLLGNLFLTVAGNGSGSVNSDAPTPGFTCSSGTCSTQLSYGYGLHLTATPGNGSIFKSWTGDCIDIYDNQCTVITDGNKNVTVTFIIMPPVRILDGDYYDTLQDAFNDAYMYGNCTIQAKTDELAGDLNVNTFNDITLAGGFNSDYSGKSGFTTLAGDLTIEQGSVTVENLVIK